MAGDGWTRDCARIGILIGKTKTRPNRPIPPPPQFPEFRIQSASDHRFLNRSIAFDSINPADYLGLGLRLGGGNALLGCPRSRSSSRIPRPQDVLVTDLFAFSIASCLYRGTRADIIWTIPHIRNNALEVGSHFVVRNQEKRFPREHFAFARQEKRFPREHFAFARQEKRSAREHFAFARQEKRFAREHFTFARQQKRFPRCRRTGVVFRRSVHPAADPAWPSARVGPQVIPYSGL